MMSNWQPKRPSSSVARFVSTSRYKPEHDRAVVGISKKPRIVVDGNVAFVYKQCFALTDCDTKMHVCPPVVDNNKANVRVDLRKKKQVFALQKVPLLLTTSFVQNE